MADAKPAKESTNVTEKLEEFFRSKITEAPKDNHQAKEWIKDTWDDDNIKLKRGSRQLADKAFTRVMREKGFEVPEGTFKNAPKASSNSNGVVADFVGNGQKIAKDVLGESNQTPQTQNNYGIFGNKPQTAPTTTPMQTPAQTPPPEERKPVSLDDQKKMMRSMFDFPKQMFYQFNLIEGEEPPKDIPQNFSEKVDQFADNVAVYCFENNMKMPTWIEGFGLVLAGLMIFGSPILMKVMKAKSESKKKEKSSKSGQSLANLASKAERDRIHGDNKKNE